MSAAFTSSFSSPSSALAAGGNPGAHAVKLLNALPHPVIAVLPDGSIASANPAAEAFFGMSRTSLRHLRLAHLVAAGSPLLSLVEQVKSGCAAINEYRVELSLAKVREHRLVDIFVTPLQSRAMASLSCCRSAGFRQKLTASSLIAVPDARSPRWHRFWRMK